MPLFGCRKVPPLGLCRVTRNQPALCIDNTEVMLRVYVTQCRLTLQLRHRDLLGGGDDIHDHPTIGTRHQLRREAEGEEPDDRDRAIQSRAAPHATPRVIGFDDRTLLESQECNRDVRRQERRRVVPKRNDAPICQDSRSRSQVCGLARSVVCHHALKDLAGEKAFETADDLPFGPPFSGASFDVVEGW